MDQGPEQKNKTSHHRLRAVFVADMTDFSGAMSVNKSGAINTFNEIRLIVCRQLQTHGGGLFGMPGDGVFALFESAEDAVRCALGTQHQLALRADAEDMRLRIGIHVGEVHFQHDLPFGEALTIAARLEALADPGGILVSAAVMEAASARISATFEERGVKDLKNIPRQILTFAVKPPAERNKADEARAGMSSLDRTMEIDLGTLTSLREQQIAEAIGHERSIAQPEAVKGGTMPASGKTEPPTEDRAGAQAKPANPAATYAAPPAAQPSEDAGKRVAPEPPVRQASQKTAIQSGRSASAPNAGVDVSPQPAGQLPAECIELLTKALAVSLGELAQGLINASMKDASSNEHLVSLVEKHIPSNEDRFQFRIRAMHICRAFANQPSDDA
jgi:class 3 adenylate cyclase